MQVDTPRRDALTDVQEMILSSGCARCGRRLMERIDVLWGPTPGAKIIRHWRADFALCVDCANHCLGVTK